MSNRDIVDEIDRLVDESLERGPVDDYSMNYYDKCEYCGETWHALAITHEMYVMRSMGIMDPSYRYSEDTSDFICPGSEYKGPPTDDREWKWAKKKWGRRPGWVRTESPTPALPPGRLTVWRYTGSFDGWEVALDDTRELSDVGPFNHQRPRVLSSILTATFTREHPIRAFDLSDFEGWLDANREDVAHETYSIEHGLLLQMKPVVIPFRTFRVGGDPANPYPDWIEFETTYDISRRHPWFAPGWESLIPEQIIDDAIDRQGYESDVVIIDEAHEHTNEELRNYVDQLREQAYRYAIETARTALEAGGPNERESSVLPGGEEAEEERDRSMAASARAREIQAALDPAFRASIDSPEETRNAGYDEHFFH